MTIDKLFDTLNGSYHDGALMDAQYKDGKLFMYCFRNPPDPDGVEDPNTRYIIIRFDDVTDLEIYDWDSRNFVPYTNNSLNKEDEDWAICGIDYLDYEDEGDFVVFGQCLRFHCDDLEVLASSSEELDFSQYCN